MKNFAKLLVVALSVAMIASLLALIPSAAAETLIDPNTLTPGSERVVFIKDAERDENNLVVGELPGDGSGSDAENPLIPMDHEDFDPGADYPKYHLQTAFYQATEMLKDTGGTIVVCGPVYFGIYESYGSGGSTRDTFTAKFGENTIKVTSVYNGVDYRETAGAKITIALPAEIGMYGQSIWENIDIETADTHRVISFSNYATLVGEGVKCYPSDEAFEGVAANYVSLSGGHRYSGGVDLTTNLVVKSGSYNVIAAGEWGVNNTRRYNDAEDPNSGIKSSNNLDGNTRVNVVLEGTTTVYGAINGTNQSSKTEFSGNTYITINDGNYECDINGCGASGFINDNAEVHIKINGGKFRNAWSINDSYAGCSNLVPAVSHLDFSGWKGELEELAAAFSVVTTFTQISLPEGVTEDKLVEIAESLVEETEPEETEPTTPDATEPTADATEPVADATEPQKDDEKESETVPENNNGGNGGINPVIFIVIGIVVVVAVVVVLVIVLGKKKKA